ncbi:unnamed protein product [Mytilus coruscus]|uniref:Reverse transcriptase domain-containing protein n=1 Tax=Mytilus coruscus TaxID=42192 RepID=A0A6J8E4S4_MYTCO|nr:unnamed protein product [Mytilus coruscus]
MPVKVNHISVAALVDSGSSINIISKSFYDSLSDTCKPSICSVSEKIVLANNQSVNIVGKCTVKIQVPQGKHWIHTYSLTQSSHPLILGTSYLISKKIVLDFSSLSVSNKTAKVKLQKHVIVDPNSELLIWGKVSNYILQGQTGMCQNSSHLLKSGLLISKTVVTVNSHRTVPIKLLNPTNDQIRISRGDVIANFEPFTDDYILINADEKDKHFVQNVQLDNKSHTTGERTESKFLSNFELPKHLSTDEQRQISQFLIQYKDLFVTDENPRLGYTELVKHNICLKPDFKPKHQQPYRLSLDKKNVLRDHSDELLKQGIISPVQETEDIPVTSPIVLVSKRTRPQSKNNSIIKNQEVCHSLDFVVISDLSSGYFQLPISKESQRYTAFNTCFGSYKFLRLPMGLSSAPVSMQLLMDKVLKGLTFRSCLCYLDDILIVSETFEDHIGDLNEVFNRPATAELKLGPKKCSFAQSSLISKDGIQPPADRVSAVLDMPSPTSVKDLRRAIGLFNWFRKYIHNFSAEVDPMTKLLKKSIKFKWGIEQEQAFKKVKSLLVNSPVLAFPKYDLPFYLAVDTSCKGIGYMLYQHHPTEDTSEELRVIRFGSKSLRDKKFVVECDHQALKPLFQKQLKGAIYERWIAKIQQFNFELRYKPGKDMQVADALSCAPNKSSTTGFESPDQLDPYFPYHTENVGNIITPNGMPFTNLLCSDKSSDTDELQLNNIDILQNLFSRPVSESFKQTDFEYDGDTEENDDCVSRKFTKKRVRTNQPLSIAEKPVVSDMSDSTAKVSEKENSIQSSNGEIRFSQTSDENLMMNTSGETSPCNDQFITNTIEESQSALSSTNIPDSDSLVSATVDDLSDVNFISDEQTVQQKIELLQVFRNCDFSPKSIKQLQINDPQFGNIFRYLEKGDLPQSQKLARKVLLESGDFSLFDGLLFHTRVARSKRTQRFCQYQLALPEIAAKQLFRFTTIHHLEAMAGFSIQ